MLGQLREETSRGYSVPACINNRRRSSQQARLPWRGARQSNWLGAMPRVKLERHDKTGTKAGGAGEERSFEVASSKDGSLEGGDRFAVLEEWVQVIKRIVARKAAADSANRVFLVVGWGVEAGARKQSGNRLRLGICGRCALW